MGDRSQKTLMNGKNPILTKEEAKEYAAGTLRGVLDVWRPDPVVDDDDARDRINWYFSKCMERGKRPTVEELYLSFGVAKNTITAWRKTGSSRISQDLLRQAEDVIAAYDAQAVSDGLLNPVVYIFRSKNYYGMKDQTNFAVETSQPLGDLRDVKRLEDKYLKTIETTAEIKEDTAKIREAVQEDEDFDDSNLNNDI